MQLPGSVLLLVSLLTGAAACASLTNSDVTAVPLYPPRQMRLECGERYVWLPFERTIVVTIPLNSCWSDWLALPSAATLVDFRADGVLDVQVSGPKGDVSVHEAVNPVARIPELTRPTAVRYRNRQSRPVTVEIDLK